MQDFMYKSWVKAQMVKQSAKNKARSVKERLMSEDGAEGIIVAIILILIVLVLAFAFKDYIIDWFNKLIGKGDEMISDNADTSNWGVNTPNASSGT